jgi:hypothetical protein
LYVPKPLETKQEMMNTTILYLLTIETREYHQSK